MSYLIASQSYFDPFQDFIEAARPSEAQPTDYGEG